MQDQGTSNWFEANDLLSDASNHDTDGAKFKDWRLPTKKELNLMYLQRGSIGGFDFSYSHPSYSQYWSSTESDFNNAWRQYFNWGNQDYGSKSFTYYVRAVRAF